MVDTELSQSAEKSFIGQIFSFSAVQFFLQFRGLITLPIMSRLIGADGFGLASPLMALSALAQSLLILGVSTSMTIFIPGYPPEQRRRDFWSLAQVILIFSAISVPLMILFYPLIRIALLPPEMTMSLFFAGIIAVPVSTLQMVLYAQIVNNHEGKAYSIIMAITTGFELIVTIAAAYYFGVIGFLYATAGTVLVQCVLMLHIIRSQDAFVWLNPSTLPHLKKYYTYGLTMFIAGLASLIVDSSDRFIVGKFLGAHELGIYQVAYNLGYKLNQLAGPVFAALMPFVAGAINSGERDKAKKYLEQSYKILLFIFVPGVTLMSLTSHDLLSVFTTEEFMSGAVIVPFVAAGIAIWQINGIYTYNIHAHKRGQVIILSTLCGAMINLVLNLIFVPRYGIIVAAISTFLAYIVIFVINRYFARQSLVVELDKIFLFKMAMAAFGMAISVILLQTALRSIIPIIRLVSAICIGGGVYLLLIYWLRMFSNNERQQLWGTARAVFKRPREN